MKKCDEGGHPVLATWQAPCSRTWRNRSGCCADRGEACGSSGSSVSRRSASVSATPSTLSPSCRRHRARLPPLQRRAPEIQVLRPSSGLIPRTLPKLPPLRLKSLLHSVPSATGLSQRHNCESRYSSSQSRRWRSRRAVVPRRGGSRYPATSATCLLRSLVARWMASYAPSSRRARTTRTR
jgi:hypothetical protein